jgi:hypothetical protein
MSNTFGEGTLETRAILKFGRVLSPISQAVGHLSKALAKAHSSLAP